MKQLQNFGDDNKIFAVILCEIFIHNIYFD